MGNTSFLSRQEEKPEQESPVGSSCGICSPTDSTCACAPESAAPHSPAPGAAEPWHWAQPAGLPEPSVKHRNLTGGSQGKPGLPGQPAVPHR